MYIMDRVGIILTTTVHTQQKIALYQTQMEDRLFYYSRSIRQWLHKTPFKVVLVENTGYPYTEFKDEFADYIREGRLEIITYVEQTEPEAANLNGNPHKGSSELFAIHYAYCQSRILCKCDFIVKVTGRYYVPGLLPMLETKGDLTLYDGLRQNNPDRCEIVGASLRKFPLVFNKYLLNHQGAYDGHVENIYKYRISLLDRVIESPVFHIDPTPMGGGPDIRDKL